jgi:hypothetical protein
MYVLPAYYDVTYHVVENFDVVNVPTVRRKKYKIISDTVEPLFLEPPQPVKIINVYKQQTPTITPIVAPAVRPIRLVGLYCNFNCAEIHSCHHHHHGHHFHHFGCHPITRITRYWENCTCKSMKLKHACSCHTKKSIAKSECSETEDE